MPEVEIAYCHACGDAMDVSAVEPFTNVECPSCKKHTRVKREFGPYTLMRRHAVGGMSVVFIAQDNTLDREVVVKLLNKEYSEDETRIASFEEEARITASISHPNVVRVFTTGRAFGRFFIAMEYVTGGHFEHHISERGHIPETEALKLAIEVGDGLKAAHHAGLIHRDVKPGNILIESGGGAKIVDFGLALVTQGGTAKATEIWATPYYVPPETIEGQEEDFRSDIYAFGATFYHALAGRPSCDEQSMDTTRLRQAKREVAPLASVAAWLHPATCAVIDRCMSYDSDGRFRSYEDLISALLDAREQSANSEQPPDTTAVPAKARRSRGGAGLGSKVALGFAILVVVAAAAFALKTVMETKPVETGGTEVVPDDTPPPELPVKSGPSNPGGVEVGRLYAEAAEALKQRDYALAGQRLCAVRDHRRVLEPTGSWAACEVVATAYLEGDSSRARQEVANALRHIEEANGLNGDAFVRIEAGLQALRKMGPVPPPDPAEHDPLAALLAFLGGLKNWEQGMLQKAEPHFVHLATMPTDGGGSPIAAYIPIAEAYLSDLKILRIAEPTNFSLPPQQGNAIIAELDGVLDELKTKGRARFNVRVWQLELERWMRSPNPGGGEKRPNRQAVLNRLFRECNFAQAGKNLRGWDPGGTRMKARRDALLMLNDAAMAFLTELGEEAGRSQTGGPVKGRDGTEYPEVVDGDPTGLVLTTADGSSERRTWAELDPESLIDLHRQLSKETTAQLEVLRRHEQAISFGLLAGDEERAKAAGAKLAELSETFRERWERIARVLD